jgi:hypothetical protein
MAPGVGGGLGTDDDGGERGETGRAGGGNMYLAREKVELLYCW